MFQWKLYLLFYDYLWSLNCIIIFWILFWQRYLSPFSSKLCDTSHENHVIYLISLTVFTVMIIGYLSPNESKMVLIFVLKNIKNPFLLWKKKYFSIETHNNHDKIIISIQLSNKNKSLQGPFKMVKWIMSQTCMLSFWSQLI